MDLKENLQRISLDKKQLILPENLRKDVQIAGIKGEYGFKYKDRLEYIQSSGTQYIDVGANCNNTVGFEIDFALANLTDLGAVCGARSSGISNRFALIQYNSVFHMMVGSDGIWNIRFRY